MSGALRSFAQSPGTDAHTRHTQKWRESQTGDGDTRRTPSGAPSYVVITVASGRRGDKVFFFRGAEERARSPFFATPPEMRPTDRRARTESSPLNYLRSVGLVFFYAETNKTRRSWKKGLTGRSLKGKKKKKRPQ